MSQELLNVIDKLEKLRVGVEEKAAFLPHMKEPMKEIWSRDVLAAKRNYEYELAQAFPSLRDFIRASLAT